MFVFLVSFELKSKGIKIYHRTTGFVQTPPSQRSSGGSGEQSINSQDLSKIPPRFGYRTALSGGKKLPDNPGGGGSWDANNQDNEDEFAWKNVQKDPEVWSKYQEYCQDQSKKSQQCDLIEIESKIKEDSRLVGFAEDAGKDKKIQRDLNGLIEQLRLGNESPGTGTKPLFKGVKEARARSGARVYFRKKNGKIEILAKSNKNPKDQKTVIKILRKKYG
jgi:putative component of toxin-antitoxin plasmid stabilization module